MCVCVCVCGEAGGDGEVGGENWEPQLLPALSGLLKEWGWLWRGGGGGGRRRGEMRVRERARKSLAGSPALSFTPNQALV